MAAWDILLERVTAPLSAEAESESEPPPEPEADREPPAETGL